MDRNATPSKRPECFNADTARFIHSYVLANALRQPAGPGLGMGREEERLVVGESKSLRYMVKEQGQPI